MYTKEVERVLNVTSITNLTADKLIYKINAKNENTPYIVYKSYDERACFKAEGEIKSNIYFIQVEINDKVINFNKLKKEIYKQAKLNNWTREGGTYDDYDSQSELYFCCLRFSFVLKEDL